MKLKRPAQGCWALDWGWGGGGGGRTKASSLDLACCSEFCIAQRNSLR